MHNFQVSKLYDEIKSLKRTLDFYAHRGNYRTTSTSNSSVAHDGGRLARIALTTKVMK